MLLSSSARREAGIGEHAVAQQAAGGQRVVRRLGPEADGRERLDTDGAIKVVVEP